MVLVVKKLLANAGDIRNVGLIPGLRRSPGGGHGNLLQYSSLENFMHRGGLRGYSPQGLQESDMSEVTQRACIHN